MEQDQWDKEQVPAEEQAVGAAGEWVAAAPRVPQACVYARRAA